MEQYVGEMDLRDGNRVHFLVSVAIDGKAVTECGFEKPPTEENIEEFEVAMRMMFEDWFGPVITSQRVDATAENPEMMKQETAAGPATNSKTKNLAKDADNISWFCRPGSPRRQDMSHPSESNRALKSLLAVYQVGHAAILHLPCSPLLKGFIANYSPGSLFNAVLALHSAVGAWAWISARANVIDHPHGLFFRGIHRLVLCSFCFVHSN
jgi:hypothetical protein